MFGNIGYLDHEPFIGYDVMNEDGAVRVKQMPEDILERAKAFSDTAAVVLYRHGGEGADHEKGDERLSEGEAAMPSFCTANFQKVIVGLACNSVIDGDFLVRNMEHKFYMYTYGGVYQEVESSGWQQAMEATRDDLADLALLSGSVTLI